MRTRLNRIAVLFADMTGSTRLYAVRGNEEAYAIAATCLALMERCVAEAGGESLKRAGDGILAVFPSPREALEAAVAIRKSVAAEDGPRLVHGVTIHFGISHGEGVRVEGDVYGDVVNVAARLLGRAELDEILMSGSAYEGLDSEMRRSLRLIGELELRNRPDRVLVYSYVGDEDDTATAIAAREIIPVNAVEIALGEQLFVVGAERSALRIGRAADNDLVVDDPAVSRRHVSVELRDGKFFLRDLSTNGTTVELATGDDVLLRREEVMLFGSGRILLSRSAPAIDFRVVSNQPPPSP